MEHQERALPQSPHPLAPLGPGLPTLARAHILLYTRAVGRATLRVLSLCGLARLTRRMVP